MALQRSAFLLYPQWEFVFVDTCVCEVLMIHDCDIAWDGGARRGECVLHADRIEHSERGFYVRNPFFV